MSLSGIGANTEAQVPRDAPVQSRRIANRCAVESYIDVVEPIQIGSRKLDDLACLKPVHNVTNRLAPGPALIVGAAAERYDMSRFRSADLRRTSFPH